MAFETALALFAQPSFIGAFEVLSEAAAADRGGSEHLTRLFQRRIPEGHFRVLAQNRAGCLVALFRESVDTPWEEAPVSWLDSDGTPLATFAASLPDFLGLALYPDGAIYDAIRTIERATDTTRGALIEEWATRTEEERELLRQDAEEMGEEEEYDAMAEQVASAGASAVVNSSPQSRLATAATVHSVRGLSASSPHERSARPIRVPRAVGDSVPQRQEE